MRSKKELYELLLESLEKGNKEGYYNNGLCGEMEDLYYNNIISNEECNFLYADVKSYNPATNILFKKYTRSKFYQKGNSWWFTKMWKGNGGRNVRIRLIKDIIKSL